MEVKTKEYKIKTYVIVEYSSLPRRGIYAYRMITKSDLKDVRFSPKGQHSETTSVVEGICRRKDLDTLKDKIPRCDWILVPPSLLKEIQIHGYYGNHTEEDVWDNFIKDPFTSLMKHENRKLVRFDWDSHMIFDVEGKALPVAIVFEYTSGQMDDRNYDLTKALSILSKRKDIQNLSKVLDIPYYNASSGRRHCIYFTWVSDIKDYQLAWDRCKQISTEFPSTNFCRAVFELDLLGLRKGDAAKHNDFYGAEEA